MNSKVDSVTRYISRFIFGYRSFAYSFRSTAKLETSAVSNGLSLFYPVITEGDLFDNRRKSIIPRNSFLLLFPFIPRLPLFEILLPTSQTQLFLKFSIPIPHYFYETVFLRFSIKVPIPHLTTNFLHSNSSGCLILLLLH